MRRNAVFVAISAMFAVLFVVFFGIHASIHAGLKYDLRDNVEMDFENCFDIIQQVTNKSDKTVEESKRQRSMSAEISSNAIRRGFIVRMDENSYIEAYLKYRKLKDDPERGEETIILTYCISAASYDAEVNNSCFDLEFFSSLIQAVSRKDVTKEALAEFLSAPEDKYPASRYGFKKLNGEKVAKIKYLNIGGDWPIVSWGLDYYERKNSALELGYWGPIDLQ